MGALIKITKIKHMRKGIVLAGGKGTRLGDLTKAVSKQLLPIYDKPMVYAPISSLVRAGIREILIISTPEDIDRYKTLLGNGSQWGLSFAYKVQEKPNGLAKAFEIGEAFIGEDDVCLALGDNIFYGKNLSETLKLAAKSSAPTIIGCKVKNLSEFGVAEVDKDNNVLSIEEKPADPKGEYAVVGLYFYPNDVIEIAKNIRPSERGEYEITSVNKKYLNQNRLKFIPLDDTVAWLDTGNPANLYLASKYAKRVAEWTKEGVADVEKIAKAEGFLSCDKKKNGEDKENISAETSPRKGLYAERWKRLLSPTRIVVEGEVPSRRTGASHARYENRTDFERDYERVAFSAPLRRLAGKTQVQAFPEIDFVHNRLTHSLEVSAVAESLARNICVFLEERGDVTKRKDVDAICWIAKTAGMAHDLGNPPYGHAGEYAIQQWAKLLEHKFDSDNEVWKDFEMFDGNAQTFRMLASGQTRTSDSYKLTAASLGAVLKYPTSSRNPIIKKGHAKFNIFQTEVELFNLIWKEMDLGQLSDTARRHPLSYVAEAADDICYRVLDFEDAVVAGIIDDKMVIDIFRAGLGMFVSAEDCKAEPIQKLRSRIIHMLVTEFTKCFIDNYDAIMTFTLEKEDLRDALADTSPAKRFLDEISRLYDTLFTERRKVLKECGAYSQIPLVLNSMYGLVFDLFSNKSKTLLPEYKDVSSLGQHLITLAWGRDFYEENRERDFSWWMHIILDYVVGMTDSYIDTVARKLTGVNVLTIGQFSRKSLG